MLAGRLAKTEESSAEAEAAKRKQWQEIRRLKGALADGKALLQAVQDHGSAQALPACVLAPALALCVCVSVCARACVGGRVLDACACTHARRTGCTRFFAVGTGERS